MIMSPLIFQMLKATEELTCMTGKSLFKSAVMVSEYKDGMRSQIVHGCLKYKGIFSLD